MISLTEAKKQATLLKEFLTQKNTGITQSSCLQAIAKMHGYNDWNTMSAILKNQSISSKYLWDTGSPVQIFSYPLRCMSTYGPDGKFGEDAYRLLIAILSILKENSLIVTGLTRRSILMERWAQEKFDSALNQLQKARFIDYTHDKEDHLIVTINPMHFWKGSKEKHFEALELFNVANAINVKLVPDIEYFEELVRSNFKMQKVDDSDIDMAAVIVFAENKNEYGSTWRQSVLQSKILDQKNK